MLPCCLVYLWRENSKKEYILEKIEFDYFFSDFANFDNNIVGINFSQEIHYFDKRSEFKPRKDHFCFQDCFYSPKQDFMVSKLTNKKFALINENTHLLQKMFTLETKDENISKFIKAFFSSDGSHVIIQNTEYLSIFPVYGFENSLAYEPIYVKDDSEISSLLMIKKNFLIVGHQNGEIFCYFMTKFSFKAVKD